MVGLRNVVPKKLFTEGDTIECVITEIDKDKRRIAISHKLAIENPYQSFDKHPEGSEVNGIISNSSEYALYIKIDNLRSMDFYTPMIWVIQINLKRG